MRAELLNHFHGRLPIPGHQKLARTKAWQEHSEALQASWAMARDKQRAALTSWRRAEIPDGCPVGKTLLYPFSGPDFLNAYWLFPDCAQLVMFGLERIGKVPDVEGMTEKEFEQLLASVRSFMINVFERNYFVTGTMLKRLRSERLRGVVPVLMVLMALSDVEVLRVAPDEIVRFAAASAPPVTPDPQQAAQHPRKHGIRSISIDFRTPGSRQVRRLNFFSLDATNTALADYPEFLAYLRSLAPTTTLIKSASYLLHGKAFSDMREALLDSSGFLLQDDTGMPYAVLRKQGWQVRLYGEYGVPIKPFQSAYQPALAAAYVKARPAALPFRFGYQIDGEDNRSHVIVARRPSGGTVPVMGSR